MTGNTIPKGFALLTTDQKVRLVFSVGVIHFAHLTAEQCAVLCFGHKIVSTASSGGSSLRLDVPQFLCREVMDVQ